MANFMAGIEPNGWEGFDVEPPDFIECGRIVDAVCAHFGVTLVDFFSRRRMRKIAKARHAASWIARTYTRLSLPEIGMKMGGVDHTTIIHGFRRVDADPDLSAHCAMIAASIGLEHGSFASRFSGRGNMVQSSRRSS